MVSDIHKFVHGLIARTYYFSSALLSTGGTETVVAPGSNTNGIWIEKAQLNTSAGTKNRVSLCAKNGVPTTFADSAILCNTAASDCVEIAFSSGMLIPAGLGLYFFAEGAESASGKVVRLVCYTLI